MKYKTHYILASIFVLVLCSFSQVFAQSYPEIHCKHFFYGYPTGTPGSNDLIIRDIYALSSNDETKFADWVAYKLDHDTVVGDAETERRWKADPWLEDSETLEPNDYDGAHATLKTDRGHQAPLASFLGTTSWADTNYLSNITPQKSNLNQGPWKDLEKKVRDLARAGYTVYVMTGPLYEENMGRSRKQTKHTAYLRGIGKSFLFRKGAHLIQSGQQALYFLKIRGGGQK